MCCVLDGGAKRAGGAVTIVPVSERPADTQRAIDFDDADDAILSMCTDNEGDLLLTDACSDAMMATDDLVSASINIQPTDWFTDATEIFYHQTVATDEQGVYNSWKSTGI